MSLLIDTLMVVANVSTIALSGFMKVPQILAIAKAKSPGKISLTSLMLELTSYCITLSYNIYSGYPLGTYFEYPLMVLQDVVMLFLVLGFLNYLSAGLMIPCAAFVAFMMSIVYGTLSHALILTLVTLCTPISASSKVVQLMSIIAAKDSTGIAITSWLISAYTCLTRIFTIYMESADVALLMNFTVSFLLNCAIITASLIYKPRVKKE
ncbi:solute carrier family 66 member 3 [Oratosquilla oratoria]|uniref:solute carrier family 66 member 3 n=1 Tax=Oratosquilla oratoria TaxID=337810 RepID=UPI003F769876